MIGVLLLAHVIAASPVAGPTGRPLDEHQFAELDHGAILTALTDVPGSDVGEGAAVALINAPPWVVFAACTDYARFAEFMPYVDAATVNQRAPDHTTVSFHVALPLGIERSYQLEYRDRTAGQGAAATFSSVWRYTGVGDIVDARGSWQVTPFAGGTRSLVRYTVLSDAGGSLPGWIKRRVARPAMKRVIEAVRDRVATEK